MNPSFSLQEFLRYGFCGTTLYAGVIIARTSSVSIPSMLKTGEGVAVFTVLALASGAAFYSVYRALLYPFLGRLALYLEISKRQKVAIAPRHLSPCCVPAAELARDEFRWGLRDESTKGKPKLDEWASQVHLLYTMGFSLWLGSIIGVVSSSKPNEWTCLSFWNFDYRLGVPTLVLIVAGFVSDRRRRFTEERPYQRPKMPHSERFAAP